MSGWAARAGDETLTEASLFSGGWPWRGLATEECLGQQSQQMGKASFAAGSLQGQSSARTDGRELVFT